MARSILVAVDIGNLTNVGIDLLETELRVAAALAARLKTAISLLYVEDLKSLPRRFAASRLKAEDRMKALRKQFNVPVSSYITTGPAAVEIVKALNKKTEPELVVMGTRARTGLKRLLIGSVAEEVVRHSRRPVMVIGKKIWKTSLDFAGRKQLKFLVATDLGKSSRNAEQYAISLANRVGAKVVLFHSIQDRINAYLLNTALSGKLSFKPVKVAAMIRGEAIRMLRKKVDVFRAHSVPCEYKIKKGTHSSCGVHQEGERGYSCIIMGTRGRSALLASYFGSTARETVLNATVPVITVQ